MDINETRLAQVNPILADKVRTLIKTLLDEGITIRVVQGLRTYQEQAVLYAEGRTSPGPKVTNAAPGHSYHNYALAVDLCPGESNVTPWTPNWQVFDRRGNMNPVWARMIEVGKSLGLTSGSDFKHIKDYPHMQLQGSLPLDAPTKEAEVLLLSKGKEAVWTMAGLDNNDKSA